jgi:hypothetical protein
MVLSKSELINSLQHETRILVHLASKVDRAQLDYRPTPKQRTTHEWFRYMSVMGPNLLRAVRVGTFDRGAWAAEDQAAATRSFDETIDTIAANGSLYPDLVGQISDDAMREDVTFFGRTQSRGAFLVNTVLCGHAAYRTQIFNHLKACGREELSTMNLWAGMDAPAA